MEGTRSTYETTAKAALGAERYELAKSQGKKATASRIAGTLLLFAAGVGMFLVGAAGLRGHFQTLSAMAKQVTLLSIGGAAAAGVALLSGSLYYHGKVKEAARACQKQFCQDAFKGCWR